MLNGDFYFYFGGGLFFLITFKNDGMCMYGQKNIVNCVKTQAAIQIVCWECVMNVVLQSGVDISTLCFLRCTYSLFPVLFMFIINYHYTQLRNMYHSVS